MEVGEKVEKSQVNYRKSENCGLCGHYNSAFGNCAIVIGNISPDAVCDKFTMRENDSPYRDKEFFEKEYNKNK